MKKSGIFFFFCFLAWGTAEARQKNVLASEQTWLGYFNQTRFTNRSGLWFDPHVRLTGDFADRVGMSILRLGYIYYLSDNTRLSSGYAYITAYSGSSQAPNIPEHRPWQQIQWYDKRKHFNMMQYLRLEERFRRKSNETELLNDYQFNFRIRHSMAFTIPLTGKQVTAGVPFVFINNEVMVNLGKEITYNYFDQNRFFVGAGYQFTDHLNAHIGYLNVFQQFPAGNSFINVHAIRLFVLHNPDFRKAK